MDRRSSTSLQIAGSRYCEIDAASIPTSIAPVAGTPFDFRESQTIASRLRQGHPQLRHGKGYDHHWVLDGLVDGLVDTPLGARADAQPHLAARLRDPVSGRWMEVLTTEPGVQFYSGNFLDGSLLGSGGEFIRQGDGLCLETQHAPDSPNRAVSGVAVDGDAGRARSTGAGPCIASARLRSHRRRAVWLGVSAAGAVRFRPAGRHQRSGPPASSASVA